MKATQKQINYALMLLRENGYSCTWMNAQFKSLGARMRERSGKVEDWLASKNIGEISSLIDQLAKEKK